MGRAKAEVSRPHTVAQIETAEMAHYGGARCLEEIRKPPQRRPQDGDLTGLMTKNH